MGQIYKVCGQKLVCRRNKQSRDRKVKKLLGKIVGFEDGLGLEPLYWPKDSVYSEIWKMMEFLKKPNKKNLKQMQEGGGREEWFT